MVLIIFMYSSQIMFKCMLKTKTKSTPFSYLILFMLYLFVLEKIYTKCGRRAMPTMMIGSAAVFIDCDEAWKLLLVTMKGSLYVWDLFHRKCLLHDSLASLMTSDLKSNSKDSGKYTKLINCLRFFMKPLC